MRRLLRLQYHEHTGKLLPHRHTSYRVLALLLLLTGVVVVRLDWGVHQIARAEDLAVSARIAAPVPTTAAVITEPLDGSTTNNPTITVSGTCPVESPAVNVAIYRGADLLGSTVCQSDGTFSLQVTLAAGPNTLVAKTLTITGDYGPDSSPVTVTYIIPAAPQPASSSPASGSGTTPKPVSNRAISTGGGASGGLPGAPGEGLLFIHSSQPFMLFGPSTPAQWTGYVTGGRQPYALTFRWGDGTATTYKNLGSEEHTFSHRYKTMRTYTVVVEAADAAGAHASIALAARTPYATTSPSLRPYAETISPYVFLAVYAGYLSLLSLSGALWLHSHTVGSAARSALTKATGAPRPGAKRPATRKRSRK